ncbi:MAG: DNA topoisomerase IV subunit A [Firmicutes bacterium]|nr:DNA topoisomerase IV subunit A [Bacillota bacterium]
MAKKIEEKNIIEKIYDYTLEDIMGERFGRYAKSIIQDRALPDVRDGLKPVQRRILYTMWEDKNTFDRPYRKCAKAVGDVMGKYHPHGDSSIYGAMIYMSQPWKMREIFIDIHGNNGSIDGDGPAAYRYTETRLTKIAQIMLKDINRNAVEMTLNYSDEELEPTVLPANFPNLLVNGSTGISAGYATNIPPHNLGEIIEATVHRINNPNCRLETIMDIVKGPDFPTGGVVEGKAGLIQAYETGRGRVVVKAKTEIIKEKSTHQIIIHEIPYDVLKEGLRKKIEDIKIDKKVEGIVDVRDESDKENMAKIIIDLKKDANAEFILNYLLKNTELQINYNFNMVAIVNRRPKQLGILAILDAFIAHQKDVILRRTRFDLEHAKARLHIVEGLLKAVDILDEIIKIIRASKNKADSIANLMKEFDFTEEQATAIVTMQLYRLSNTDITQLTNEKNDLVRMIEFLNLILNDEEILKKQMKLELNEVKKMYATPRRTEIRDEITDIKLDMKDMIPKEKTVVIITNEGYIKRVSPKSFAAADDDMTLKPGDYIRNIYNVNTQNTVILFTNLGNYLYIPVHVIPEGKWKELGKHVNNIVMMSSEEKVVDSIVFDSKDKDVTITTKLGMVKRVKIADFEVTRYSKPITAMKLKEDDEVVTAKITGQEILLVTLNGYYLRYATEEIPIIGPKASGVKAINLKDDYVVSADQIFENSEYLNIVTNNNTAKRIRLDDLVVISRAKKGNLVMKKPKSKDYTVAFAYVSEARTINLMKCDSEITEIKNADIPIMDLSSTGSLITKNKVDEIRPKWDIYTLTEEKVVEQEPIIKEKQEEQLSFDDFINDFKI